MALTIVWEGKGIIANCDAYPNDTAGGTWSEVGGGSIEYGTDAYLVGSGCIAGAYSNKSGRQQYELSSALALDFSSGGAEEGQLIYIWIQTSTIYLHESLANEGLSILVMTGTGDYRKFIIAAGDDTNGWNGDWKCFIIDPTLPGSVADTGTYDEGNVNYISVDLDITALAKGNNILIDQIAVGTGLRVTGTSTTPWDDIVTYCTDYSNRAWGVVQEREGIYYIYGKIIFGDNASYVEGNQSFVETSAPVIQFGTREYYTGSIWEIAHPVDYAGIIIEDYSGYTTTFDDGVIVGTNNGRSGTTFIGHDDIDVFVDLYGGQNTSSLTRLYGTQFRNIRGGITWGNDANHLFYGGAIIECGQFDPVGAVVLRNLRFISTDDLDAALLWNSNIDIQNCEFISNTLGAAIEHNNSGTVNYTNLTFSDNTNDVLFNANDSAGVLNVNNNGSNATSYEVDTGDSSNVVNFAASFSITITVKDKDGLAAIQGARVSVYEQDDPSVVHVHEKTNVSGVASDTFNYSGDFTAIIAVRKSSKESGIRYFDFDTTADISNANFAQTILLEADDIAA